MANVINNSLLEDVGHKVTAKNTSAQGLRKIWVKALAAITLPSRDSIIRNLNAIYVNYRVRCFITCVHLIALSLSSVFFVQMVSKEEDARQKKKEREDAADPTSGMKGQLGAPIQNFAASKSSTSSLPSASRFPVGGSMPAIGQSMLHLNAPVRLGGYNSRTQPPLNTSYYSSMNDPGLLRPLCPPEQAQRFRNQGPPNKPRNTIYGSALLLHYRV